MLNYKRKTLSNYFSTRPRLAPCRWVVWWNDRRERGRTGCYEELLSPQPSHPHTKLIQCSDTSVTQPKPPNCPSLVTPKWNSQLKFTNERELWGLSPSIHKLWVAVTLTTHVKEKNVESQYIVLMCLILFYFNIQAEKQLLVWEQTKQLRALKGRDVAWQRKQAFISSWPKVTLHTRSQPSSPHHNYSSYSPARA